MNYTNTKLTETYLMNINSRYTIQTYNKGPVFGRGNQTGRLLKIVI